MVSFELEERKMFFVLLRAWDKGKRNPKVWGLISHGDSELFLCPTLVTRRKKILLYFFTELKTYHLSFLLTNMTLSTLLILAVYRTRAV